MRPKFQAIVDALVLKINTFMQFNPIITQRDIAKFIYDVKPEGYEFIQHQSHDLGQTIIKPLEMPDLINHEWLYDVSWLKHKKGQFGQIELILACEIEYSYSMSNYESLLKDFQKIIVSSAPFKLLVVKCLKEHNAGILMNKLIENVNPAYFTGSNLAILILCGHDKEKVKYRLL